MSSSNSNKHLTFEERTIIEKGIRSGATKAAIASTIGKDKSTICKKTVLTDNAQKPVISLLNVLLTKNVNTIATAPLHALTLFSSSVRSGIALLAHAMAVKKSRAVISITFSTNRILLKKNTRKFFQLPVKASIFQKRSSALSERLSLL